MSEAPKYTDPPSIEYTLAYTTAYRAAKEAFKSCYEEYQDLKLIYVAFRNALLNRERYAASDDILQAIERMEKRLKP